MASLNCCFLGASQPMPQNFSHSTTLALSRDAVASFSGRRAWSNPRRMDIGKLNNLVNFGGGSGVNGVRAVSQDVSDTAGPIIGNTNFDITRLEAYTERMRSEVLCVNAFVDEEEDQVIVFKGFSSSLMRSTAVDLSESVLPDTATILSIDRIQGPYNPSDVQYIEQGLSWQDFEKLLQEQNL